MTAQDDLLQAKGMKKVYVSAVKLGGGPFFPTRLHIPTGTALHRYT